MAISGVSNTTTSATGDAASALSSATTQNQALGKDAFLKLLVAQISHQDPLKPMDDTAFVAQLAQFSSLEQQVSTNTKLDALSQQNLGLANTQVSAMVGKNVTVNGSSVALGSDGIGAPVHFGLSADTATTAVTIRDASGNQVRTVQLGAQKTGTVNMTWDGRNDEGIAQPAGNYSISVEGKTTAGAAVDVSQQSTGTVKSVSFEKGYAELQLDNGVSSPASGLLSVNAASGTSTSK